MTRHGDTAIVAKRTAEAPAETDEIRALAESAGYEILDAFTQVRPPDPSTEFGSGAVEALGALVGSSGADAVIVDNDLDPHVNFALEERLEVDVIDRKRLVLDVFADRAETRRARLEVELAEKRYELPRAEAAARRGETKGRQGFKSAGETEASQVRAAHKREIAQLERKLDALETQDDRRRADRRESGFDLVALAGYTNAGKSTLLRRLADDMTVSEDSHDDLSSSATARGRLFETLNTTTRRATLGDRRTLVTDTVGFVADLPHWLVDSFETTLAESYDADVVVLVVDASDDPAEVARKVKASMDVLSGFRDGGIVPVLNKADVATGLDEKRRIVRERAGDPVTVSALDGTAVGALIGRIADKLPEYEATILTVPNGDEAMRLVSWCYDRGHVERVEYGDDVTVEFEARPEVVAQAEGRATQIGR